MVDISGEENTAKIISSGAGELDRKLGGGIPPGSFILVEGQSGAGKSVLCQQIIWGSLREGHTVALFTTENTIRSLLSQMESLNLDVLPYLLMCWLSVFPVRMTTKDQTFAEGMLRTLSNAIQQQEKYELVIVDSLTPFIAHASMEQTIAFLEDCKSMCDKGVTIILVVHSYSLTESELIRMRSMCDGSILLRVEEMGQKLLKVMEVAKIRGATKNTGNIVSFDVEPGLGMRIIPVSKAQV